MIKITIEEQNGQKTSYNVPDYIGNAVDSLLMPYPHEVLGYAKRDETCRYYHICTNPNCPKEINCVHPWNEYSVGKGLSEEW